MDNFDDIRNKELDSLTDEDKSVIKEHTADFTDEEKEAFKGITEPEIPDEPDETPDEPDETPETPPKPPVEEFKFSTQSDFEDAVTKRTEALLEERERKAAEAKLKPDEVEDKFFPDDYQAKDWNEAMNQVYPKFKDKILKEQQAEQKASQDRIAQINREFDAEIDTLAETDTSIPATGTPERTDYVRELTKIGLEYTGVTNMSQAHKIYTALNSDKPAVKPVVNTTQKDVAAKVGRTSGEGTPAKGRKYSEMAGKSLDEMIDEDMESLGVKN